MNVKQIRNHLYNSNTYIIYSERCDDVWLVDCGDYARVDEFCKANAKRVAGVLVTHSHFDHVYGLNALLTDFPATPIYLSAHNGVELLSDSKLNFSFYADMAFVVANCTFVELDDGQDVPILDGSSAKVMVTEGHSPDSLTFVVSSYVFTGDAFIPNIRPVTKLRGGNRAAAMTSVNNIYNFLDASMYVCPGHNDICKKEEIVLSEMLY